VNTGEQMVAQSTGQVDRSIQGPRTIGIVGAGGIVKAAHLPAYRTAGFSVAAIYDRDAERATSLADEFGIPKVCRELQEMLDDSSIAVMDIAVPPESQSEIVLHAIRRGKHLLCQKPLARTAAGAEILVKAAEDAGVKLAVNVSMRWAPAMQETAKLIRRGVIGDVRTVLFDIKYYEYWNTWPWLGASDRLVVLFDMIHILDVTRTILGPARSVKARYGRAEDSDVAGETWADIALDYRENVTGRFDEDSRIPPDQTAVRFRFTGSCGTIAGTLGIYYDYPFGRADTLRQIPAGVDEETVLEKELPGRWVPDAFSETMRALLAAIENDSVPGNSGRDHLETLRLVDSIYGAGRLEMLPHRPERD
jgi:predicted dehydrogenase